MVVSQSLRLFYDFSVIDIMPKIEINRPKNEVAVPSSSRVFDFIGAFEGLDALFFTLLASCGLRRGEALALKIDDFSEGHLKISRHVDYFDNSVVGTKSRASRVIAISRDIYDEVCRAYEENEAGVFVNSKDSRYKICACLARLSRRYRDAQREWINWRAFRHFAVFLGGVEGGLSYKNTQ